MNLADAALLQEIRPYELGSRLRAARLARGWTQTELAGDMVSVGYVSRLESGHRRPNAEVLEALAQRLGVSTDQLLRGPTAPEQDELRLALDFAELSLENGEHAEAEVQARQARDRARAIVHEELAGRATYLIARALESQGNVDDAILELEPLVNGEGGAIPRAGAAAIPRAALPAIPRIKAAIALSRCYRESGDLSLAIDAGSACSTSSRARPLDSTRRGRAARGHGRRRLPRSEATPARPSGPAARRSRRPSASTRPRRAPRPTGTPASSSPSADPWPRRSRWRSAPSRCSPRGRTAATSPGCAPRSPTCSCSSTRPTSPRRMALLDLAAEELSSLQRRRARHRAQRRRPCPGAAAGRRPRGCAASSALQVHARVAEQSPLAAADAKLIEGQAAAAAGRTDAAGAGRTARRSCC